jgi:hypothetical protein
MSRFLTTALLCLAAVAVVGNLGLLAFHVHDLREKRRLQAAGEPPPPRVEDKAVKLNANLAESYGLETEAARASDWQERVTVYGRVVPNPRATYEVRSPFAGTLQAGVGAWPAVGQTVRAGQVLGRVAVRVGPQERLDLAARLNEARLKRQGAEEVVQLRHSVVERLARARSDVVAQRDLDEARVQLAEAQTQLATAKAAVDIWQQALDEIDRHEARAEGVWSRPLAVPAEAGGGADLEVTELAGQPGVAVEAGGLVARVVDFRRVLVRLDLPAELLRAGPPPADVELVASSNPPVELRGGLSRLDEPPAAAPVKAVRVGPAPQVEASSQLVGYYYSMDNAASAAPADGKARPARTAWRPGRFVRAVLPLAAAPAQEAVSVPATALLYHQGRTLVYVRIAPDKYRCHEVQVLGHRDGRCVVAPAPQDPTGTRTEGRGLLPDDVVVTRQAQVLLSTEFRRDTDND